MSPANVVILSNIICRCLSNLIRILSVGVHHTNLAKMLPNVGIDGEVCIQCALKLTNVDLGC